MRVSIVYVLLVMLLALPAAAQIPTLEEVTGSDASERITTHAAMVHYLTAVAAASPRVTLVDQGPSWEERPLVMATITSPENHARLEEIRSRAQRLGDPRSLSGEWGHIFDRRKLRGAGDVGRGDPQHLLFSEDRLLC